ncbi:MAG: alpha/beta fold hydrolase [Steroidobacteraceae bacterium]|nr:alpha/beta fold hydrolase [Steroidobacteraceae bacterium]
MTERSHTRLELIAAFLLGGLLCPDFAQAAGIALEPCRIADQRGLVSIGARCGKFTVPEDPDDPQGAKIELAVAVVPAVATRAKPDPLFLLAGGPGQGAIQGYAPIVRAFEGIRRERDLVLVDQRGTGGSNRLDCEMPDDVLASGEFPPAELRRLATECLAQLPGRPQFYTTSIAVRDLDAVRAALGFERINLFSGSYGTRVAQHYARRYPERTRAIVLDAVVPPGQVLGPGIAIESQAALDRVFARCQADPACDQRFPGLAGQFAVLDARLRRGPAAIPFNDPVDGTATDLEVTRAHLVTMARMLSYSARAASLLPLVVHEAATRGNYAPLAAQAEMLGEDLAGMIAMGMHHSVVCAEDAPRFDGAVDRAQLARTFIGTQMLDGMEAICQVWPRGAVDADFHEPLRSQVPALLLSGEFDPATPAAYGAAAAAGFDDALHVVVPGQGHGQTRLPCVQRLLRRFIDSASPAGLDTACVEEIRPAPFFLSFSGPSP